MQGGNGQSFTIKEYKPTGIPTVDTGLSYNSDKTELTVNNNYTSTKLVSTAYESTVKLIDTSSRTKALNVAGNSLNNTIKGGSGADTLSGGAGDDSLIGNSGNDVLKGETGNDTIYGGVGNDSLTGGAGKDIFVYDGKGNDVITDYVAGQDKIKLSNGTIKKAILSGNAVIVTLTTGSGSSTVNGTLKINNAKDTSITFIDSSNKEFSTVIADTTTPATLLTVTNSTKSPVTVDSNIISINASTRTNAVKITGNSKNNSILGGSGADSLNGSTGNDTLNGGKGNDTLTGGSGKDVFYYAKNSGNDVITDYSASQGDIIKLGVSSLSSSTSGNNVILKFDSGQITVNKGKTQKISVVGSNNKTTVIGGGTSTKLPSGLTISNKTMTIKSPFSGSLNVSDYSSSVNNINASADTKFVKITGTSAAETIKAGKGGSNLIGGKGNDALYGGSGADTFTYSNGDGKDTIYNYTSYVDTIYVKSGTISKASIGGSNVVLTVGSGSITINNAKGKDINITDSSGETKTYNFTGTVTNPTKSYEERNFWFLDNAECRMQNDELESILGEQNNLINDELDFNDQINSQEKITSLTYNQTKKK